MLLYLFKKLGCLCVPTKSKQGVNIFVSEASKPPAGAGTSKGPIGPLKFKCYEIVKFIISKGYSSTLRTKRILKIQNPIRFKDFMVKIYQNTFLQRNRFFCAFFKDHCFLIQFLKTIG